MLGLAIAIGIYPFMLENLALTKIENTLIVYILAFIIIDFVATGCTAGAIKINLFWNLHIIHHSSEEFNLACALRQSISSFFNLFTVLLLPAALLGVPWEVIAVVGPHPAFCPVLVPYPAYQQDGFFGKDNCDPSHHRVHHAMNPEYMDKNLWQIFIVWDKLFGTFQEEIKEVPPVYGITRPARTWNPIKINFQHIWLLIKDAWRPIAGKIN